MPKGLKMPTGLKPPGRTTPMPKKAGRAEGLGPEQEEWIKRMASSFKASGS
jgi:hypothetical protein